jgi:hypothetical protein
MSLGEIGGPHSGHMNHTSSLPGSIPRGAPTTVIREQMPTVVGSGEMV